MQKFVQDYYFSCWNSYVIKYFLLNLFDKFMDEWNLRTLYMCTIIHHEWIHKSLYSLYYFEEITYSADTAMDLEDCSRAPSLFVPVNV